MKRKRTRRSWRAATATAARRPAPMRQARPRAAPAAHTTPAAIDRVIRTHLPSLRKPGVQSVRPGLEIRRHRLTGAPAIVATVEHKQPRLPPAARLPDKLQGIPVDVRQATPHQRLRARDPAAAALMRTTRPDEAQPDWPLERELPSGQLLSSPKSRHQQRLAASAQRQPGLARSLAAAAKKPEIPYLPAPGTPLVPIEDVATITACVSPDAGFATLRGFLEGCQSSLLIGMYDFTSAALLGVFEQTLGGQKTLRMVLDDPSPDATQDQTDDQTVAALSQTLGARAQIARALTQPDPYATAWMFPSAYHIKLIVRDGTALWLSSGNLDNSNLPDPAAPAPSVEDRDWHLIIESPALAKLFAAYLEQDYASASAHQSAPDAALRDAVHQGAVKLAALGEPAGMSAASSPSARPRPAAAGPRAAAATFPAQTFPAATIRITPLLTPDTLPSDPSQGLYIHTMAALITSATKRLYVQLQYIESSVATSPYGSLLEAIAGRVAAGVDVRLIESLEYGESWAEKMKTLGVDLTANIRLQPNVHNKGFVIDSAIVVVSSQNFSPEGVRQNRDAGVIIESAPIAQYFEQVFLADWNGRAKPFAPAGS